MIIKLTPYWNAKKAVPEVKVVIMHMPSAKKQKTPELSCSQLYSSTASLCTVVSTNLWIAYRNYN